MCTHGYRHPRAAIYILYHTIHIHVTGTREQPGLVPRICQALFSEVGLTDWTVTLSFFEIYNEQDLYHTVLSRTMLYRTDAIPYDAIPYCAIPYDAIPYYAIPYDAIPYCAIPHDAIPYYAMLRYALLLRDLQRTGATPYYTILWCRRTRPARPLAPLMIVQCSTGQYSAVRSAVYAICSNRRWSISSIPPRI